MTRCCDDREGGLTVESWPYQSQRPTPPSGPSLRLVRINTISQTENVYELIFAKRGGFAPLLVPQGGKHNLRPIARGRGGVKVKQMHPHNNHTPFKIIMTKWWMTFRPVPINCNYHHLFKCKNLVWIVFHSVTYPFFLVAF